MTAGALGAFRVNRRAAALVAAAGLIDRAVELLRRAIKAHDLDGSLASLETDPEFRALRKPPGFRKLVV